MSVDKVFKYGQYNENLVENCVFDDAYFWNYYVNEPKSIRYFEDNVLTHIPHSDGLRQKYSRGRTLSDSIQINTSDLWRKPVKHNYEVKDHQVIIKERILCPSQK